MLHGKVITIKRKYQLSMLVFLGKQIASYLQVTGFKSCYSYRVCFVEALTLFSEWREIRHLTRYLVSTLGNHNFNWYHPHHIKQTRKFICKYIYRIHNYLYNASTVYKSMMMSYLSIHQSLQPAVNSLDHNCGISSRLIHFHPFLHLTYC